MCQEAWRKEATSQQLCRRIAQAEWRLLFDYCHRAALGEWLPAGG
jgi:hypothetical protein